MLNLNEYFWDVILKIRQNVSEDIVVKTAVLKAIGIVAQSDKWFKKDCCRGGIYGSRNC